MRIVSFASSSGGNCALVSDGDVHILLDAGVSFKRIREGLRSLGLRPEDLSALLLTHEHADHIAGLPILEKYTDIPICTSGGTARALMQKGKLLGKHLRLLRAGESADLFGLAVTPFETPHDAAESLGFVFERGGRRAAAVTDLGHVTPEVLRAVCGAELALLEANHDVATLRCGPYPYLLQQRILGPFGHLSNDSAGELALDLAEAGCRGLLLAHLSRENNTPRLAYETVAGSLLRGGVAPGALRLCVAPPDTQSEIMEN